MGTAIGSVPQGVPIVVAGVAVADEALPMAVPVGMEVEAGPRALLAKSVYYRDCNIPAAAHCTLHGSSCTSGTSPLAFFNVESAPCLSSRRHIERKFL